MPDFEQKYGPWALVAGASEGLGAAYANALARRGLNLILIARRQDKLEEIAESINNNYEVEVKFFALDLADFAKLKDLLSTLDVQINLLIYNAAYSPIAYFENLDDEDLSRIVEVNIKTPLLLSKFLSSGMIERGKGGIVLMSSLAGTQGSPKIATYAASKAFSAILAEGLWFELRKHGIDVLVSQAGAIRTPGYKSAQHTKEAPGTMDPSAVAEKSLASLGKGPRYIPGLTNKLAHFLMSRFFPRRAAIKMMNSNTKNIS